MISPRPSECIHCSNIMSLISKIDCKLAELAKAEYNNVIYALNKCVQDAQIGDLLNYKRILTYKAANQNYACEFTVNMINSRVALYGLENCDCSKYGDVDIADSNSKTKKPAPYVPPSPTTTTTTSSTSSTTTSSTTKNPCSCLTFTNLRNDPTYVIWTVCPGVFSVGGGWIPGGIGNTLLACGKDPASDTPGAASWTIGDPCDQSQSFPACSPCRCTEITITGLTGPGSCVVEYYNCYGEYITETLTGNNGTLGPVGVYNRCIQEGLFNTISCADATSSIVVSSTPCVDDTDCIPIPLVPTTCTAIGYGVPSGNAGYKIENKWDDETDPLNPGGIYTFEVIDMTLDGTAYGIGSTLTVNAPGDLVVGPGVKSAGTFVMNINDWLNSIPSISGLGFVFYDDMSAVDVPDVNSTYNIIIKRTVVHTGDVEYYLYFKNSTHTGWNINNFLPVPETCYSGCWGCKPQ